MALIRWYGDADPWRSMERQAELAQRELQRLWGNLGWGQSRSSLFPAMNIYDDGESFIVRAEVPGVDPKDIEVSATGDTLNVRGKREVGVDGKECSYHRRERSGGEFRRAFTLPDNVDASKVVAMVKDGILEIRLPRAESAKQRKIQIQAG